MTEKMLKFVNIGQQNPPKRDTSRKGKTFKEIYDRNLLGKGKRTVK